MGVFVSQNYIQRKYNDSTYRKKKKLSSTILVGKEANISEEIQKIIS